MREVLNHSGITLIALIVTIILMLILAGIVVSLVIGENGIFDMATNASKNYINAQDKELADLENLYSEMLVATNDSSKITISMEDLTTLINKKVKEARPTPDYANAKTINFTGKTWTVEEDGYVQISFGYESSVTEVMDKIIINNKLIFANNTQAGWQNPFSPIFEVKKGDVITYSNTAHYVNGFYYPIRY